MGELSTARVVAAVVVAATFACASLAALPPPAPPPLDTPVEVVDDSPFAAPPPAALGDVSSATAIAVGPDGRAAAAIPVPDARRAKATLRFVLPGAETIEDSEEVEVPGRVRALLFPRASPDLFAVVVQENRRGPVTAALYAIDLEDIRAVRVGTLPLSASDLAEWRDAGALVVACRDELRTFSIPDVKSGALFPLPGPNPSVEIAPGTAVALVGRDGAVVVVNLEDTPTPDGLPIRERIEIAGRVEGLAVRDDAVFARTGDGTVHRFTLDASAYAPASRTPEPTGEARRDAADAEAGESAPAGPIVFVPEPSDVSEAIDDPEPPNVEPPEPPRRPPVEPPSEPVVAEVVPAPPPEPAVPEVAPPDGPGLYGHVAGSLPSGGVEVVLFGPGRLFVEAGRARVAHDGSWAFPSLEPGRYRLTLEVEGGVVASRPAFAVVEVVPDRPVEVRFEVLEVR